MQSRDLHRSARNIDSHSMSLIQLNFGRISMTIPSEGASHTTSIAMSVPLFLYRSMAVNSSIECTSSGKLRLPPVATHVKR
jgi:hypothetical protein